MRVFVTGVAGQLGHDVMNELQKRGIEGIGTDLKETYSGVQDGTAVTAMPYVSLDITDRDAVMAKVTELHPDVIIHCAAWTAVDLAEDEDKKPKVRAINVDGTKNLADAGRDKAWRRAGSVLYAHKVLHRPHRLGVRRQRQELHPHDAECRKDP